MKYIDVWFTFPSADKILVGEIALAEQSIDVKRSRDEPGSAFRYTQDYLAHPQKFSLHPFELKIPASGSTNSEYICDRYPQDIHQTFETALPDDWGKRLLSRQYGLKITQSNLGQLLPYLGASGLGALSFASKNENPPVADIKALEGLIQATHEFEKGNTVTDDELSKLFQAGSFPGGARPKVLIQHNDREYLAKVPSVYDSFNLARIECATLELAERCDLDVPEHQVITCGNFDVLFVERFDVTSAGGRRHMLSMQSLLRDSFYHGYDEMADVIRRISVDPGLDLTALYQQMIFNVLIGNTDDHDKNFSMLHDDDGWRLSPAYDLLPNYNQNPEHALNFGATSYPPSIESLIKLGKNIYGISPQKSRKMVLDMLGIVSGWAEVFREYDVPDDEIEELSIDIAKRLKKV